jgi:uncharacterized cupin superfamily protein
MTGAAGRYHRRLGPLEELIGAPDPEDERMGQPADRTTAADPILERGRFDVAEYADELERAPHNHDLGTSLWFANDKIRVFEVRLAPGERAPFHIHDRTYFWTVVSPGRGRQRLADGSYVVREYELGETRYLVHNATAALVHDLENVGTDELRFVTVELCDTTPTTP